MDQQTKRQLKQQDKFVTVTSHGLEWANENRRSTIVTAAILLLVILLIVGGSALYAKRSNAASSALGLAMQTYNTPVASATRPAAPGEKTFPTMKDRALAANAQFVQAADQYGMEKDGKIARYFAGLTAMEAGQNQSAEDTLKKVSSSWDGDLAALGKLALAQLYRSEGNNDAAAKLYTELADGHATTVTPSMAQLQLAEMDEDSGKVDDARKIYAQLKDKDKDAKGKEGAAGTVAEQKLNPKGAEAGPQM